MLHKKINIVSWVFGLLISSNLIAQINPIGSETIINTTTAGTQQNPTIAIDDSSNYVITWESFDEATGNWGIFKQLVDSGGVLNGGEVTVKSDGLMNYRYPRTAMNQAGAYAVVYMYEDPDDNNYDQRDGWNSYLRVRNTDGSSVISATRIMSSTTGNQVFPDVSMAPNGSFTMCVATTILSDTTSDILVRQYQSNFSATSSPIPVNTTTGNIASNAKIAVNDNGDFVVVWQYETGDGTKLTDIYGQLFNSSRTKVGSEFIINTTTAGNQTEPDVAFGFDDNFIVTWTSDDQDGSEEGVYLQEYTLAGVKDGGELLVNTTTDNAQNHSEINSTYDGYYNITWTSYGQDGSFTGVYMQALDSLGDFVGDEKKLNTRTTDFQQFPSVAQADHETEAVVVWQDGLRNSTSTHDGDNYGIYSQRFQTVDTENPDVKCKNISVYLNEEGYSPLTSDMLDNSSTDNYGYINFTLSKDTLTCSDLGFKTVTITGTDLAGNSDACVSGINVYDTILPILVKQDITVYLDGTGNAIFGANDIDNGSTDNCTLDSLTLDIETLNCSNLGANTVKLYGYDNSGNVDSITATVTVVDTISPSLSIQNITAYLDGTGNASVNATDLVNSSSDNCAVTSTVASDLNYDCTQVGVFKVEVVATDAAGNYSSDSATITLLDTVSPTLSTKDVTVYLDASGYAEVSITDYVLSSNDNCDFSVSLDDSTFTCVNVGANIGNVSAVDGSGNTTTNKITITVLDTITPTNVAQAICEGDSILLSGNYQTTSGTYNDTLTSVHSCDSIISTVLTVNPIYTTASTQAICEGDSISIFGEYKLTAGVFMDTLQTASGCDSILTITLNTNPVYLTSSTIDACDGDTYAWRGGSYTTSGVYYDSLTTVLTSCDSVFELILNIKPTYKTYLGDGMCSNDSVLWRGSYYTEGTWYDSLSTSYGCDSIFVLVVETEQAYEFDSTITVCNNETVSWRGGSYTTSGVYYDSLTSGISGCDSVYQLTVIIQPELTSSSNITICQGESYTLGAQTLSTTGSFVEVFQSVGGCDSTVSLGLEVQNVVETFDTVSFTPGVGVLVHGVLKDAVGTYTETFVQSTGVSCDSISNVTLEINIATDIETVSDIQLLIYPNPSTGMFTISSNVSVLGSRYEIFDELGKIVKRGNITEGLQKIDMSVYENGVYYVKLVYTNGVSEIKPIVLTK